MEGKALFTFVPCTYNKDRFMKITLDRINENFAFEVKDADGHNMIIDTGVGNGGDNKGFTPMQLLLIGAAGCSAIDVVHILKKQSMKTLERKLMILKTSILKAKIINLIIQTQKNCAKVSYSVYIEWLKL